MPQLFQVLRCYKCSAFQVHQTKKGNKFACKICDEKQSIKRHYGIGIAKDCRMHVQKLNKMRGEIEKGLDDVSDDNEEANVSNSTDKTSDTIDNVNRTSKWLSYMDKETEETEINDQMISETNPHTNNKRWVTNKKYLNHSPKNKKIKTKHYNVIDENDQNINENILNGDNTKNNFGKRFLSENEDDCKIKKVSKTISHDTTFPINNNYLMDSGSINKSPKLQTLNVNKLSKWVQFIERNDEMDEKNKEETVENLPKNKQSFFSLCDESDIDDVLDI